MKSNNKQATSNITNVQKSERPSFMYTSVVHTTPELYKPLKPEIISPGKGDAHIDTGWKKSAVVALSRSRSIIETIVDADQRTDVLKAENNGFKIESTQLDTVSTRVPYLGQAPILYTRYSNVKYNFAGIKYNYIDPEQPEDDPTVIPNGVAQQIELSTNAIIAEVTSRMKTDLAIVTNDEVVVATGKTTAKTSVFPRFIFAIFKSSRDIIYGISKLARIRQVLINESRQNVYLADRVNLFLKELDRSRFVTAYTELRKTLKIMMGHKLSAKVVTSIMSVQKENDSLSNVYSFSDVDLDDFLGLDSTLTRDTQAQPNWDMTKDAPELKPVNPVSSHGTVDLTRLQLFLSYYNINQEAKDRVVTLTFDRIAYWAKQLPDLEQVFECLYTDKVEFNGKTYNWVSFCEHIILCYIRWFKEVSETLPIYNSKFDDFLVAASVLPTNLTSQLVNGYDLDEIFTNTSYVTQSNDFELLFYANYIQWRDSSKTPLPNAASTTLTDATKIRAARESLIEAIVPMGNNLDPLSGFDTNSVLTIRTDYPGNEDLPKEGIMSVYAPIINAKEFAPQYSMVFIPNNDEKVMFNYTDKKPTIYPNWRLAKLSINFASSKIDSIAARIPYIMLQERKQVINSKVTVKSTALAPYTKFDLNVLKYFQSTFLFFHVSSYDYIAEDSIGKDDFAISTISVPYVNPAYSGLRPVNYKPIDYQLIDMAVELVGLKPVDIIKQ